MYRGAHLEICSSTGVSFHEHVVRNTTKSRLQPPHARPGGRVGVNMVDQGGLGPDVCACGSDASDGFLFLEFIV